MVLNANEVEKKTTADKIKITRLETLIDKALKRNFRGSHSSVIFEYETAITALKPYHLQELFNEYRQQGWDVQEHSDQREGEYITFSKK
jgi:hypothetical protein